MALTHLVSTRSLNMSAAHLMAIVLLLFIFVVVDISWKSLGFRVSKLLDVAEPARKRLKNRAAQHLAR